MFATADKAMTTENHIKPLRLFDLARLNDFRLNEDEKTHLHECSECERVLEVFARQFNKPWHQLKIRPDDAA